MRGRAVTPAQVSETAEQRGLWEERCGSRGREIDEEKGEGGGEAYKDARGPGQEVSYEMERIWISLICVSSVAAD